jgi:hypothetical protein
MPRDLLLAMTLRLSELALHGVAPRQVCKPQVKGTFRPRGRSDELPLGVRRVFRASLFVSSVDETKRATTPVSA